MRTSTRIASAAAVTLACFALVPAGSASAGADRDSVKGSGNQGVADFRFAAFNNGETATSATGAWSAENQFIDFSGPITCLTVEGNRAGFIYPIDDESKPEAARGKAVLIWIEDNGATGDKMGFFGPAPLEELNFGCAPGPTPLDITGPGVTVHDAG